MYALRRKALTLSVLANAARDYDKDIDGARGYLSKALEAYKLVLSLLPEDMDNNSRSCHRDEYFELLGKYRDLQSPDDF
jgi:hypothetical protein